MVVKEASKNFWVKKDLDYYRNRWENKKLVGKTFNYIGNKDCLLDGVVFDNCLIDSLISEDTLHSQCDFIETHFEGCNFYGINGMFSDPKFFDSSMNLCEFDSTKFDGGGFDKNCIITDCGFTSVTFKGCIFSGIKFERCKFEDVLFKECVFLGFFNHILKDKSTKTVFDDCTFINTGMSKCSIKRRKSHMKVITDGEACSVEFIDCGETLRFHQCNTEGLNQKDNKIQPAFVDPFNNNREITDLSSWKTRVQEKRAEKEKSALEKSKVKSTTTKLVDKATDKIDDLDIYALPSYYNELDEGYNCNYKFKKHISYMPKTRYKRAYKFNTSGI